MSEIEQTVRVDTDGAIGIVQFNRPDKHNCISSAVIAGAGAAYRCFAADETIRVVLLRAAGRNFCTGADLGEVQARRGDAERLQAFLEDGLALQQAFEEGPLPVVAAVQGLCLAGGLEMMLACDVVFAARSARLGDQHARFGLLPGWGGSQRLVRAIGLRRTLDLCLSGRWIDAPTALAWGLVNHVVDDAALEAEALAYCRTLAGYSRPGLAAMKRLARDGVDLPLADALRMETRTAVDILRGPDVEEGLGAFVERRPAAFGAGRGGAAGAGS